MRNFDRYLWSSCDLHCYKTWLQEETLAWWMKVTIQIYLMTSIDAETTSFHTRNEIIITCSALSYIIVSQRLVPLTKNLIELIHILRKVCYTHNNDADNDKVYHPLQYFESLTNWNHFIDGLHHFFFQQWIPFYIPVQYPTYF